MNRINNFQNRPIILLKEGNILMEYEVLQNALNNNLRRIKKDYGIFFTPPHVIDFMIKLIDITKYDNKKDIMILEPACGLLQFLIGIKRNYPTIFEKAKLFGVEKNQNIISYLENINISKDIKLIREDYLLWKSEEQFDLIIGNPPYGIPSSSSHYTIKVESTIKDKYKDMFETWYGKYNVYGAFIEKSIKLLKPGGQLNFIVPATFMILDEFKKLRKYLSQNGETKIIYMGPDIFKPEADVSSVVLNFTKSKQFTSKIELLEYKDSKINTIRTISNWNGEIITFETDYTRKLESICSYRLGDIYEIRISPRTPEIKNSLYVQKGNYLAIKRYLPLLNGRNLKCNEIIYENFTNYFIKKEDKNKLRSYFDIPHIVVGLGFRGNGKVASAIDKRCYPWMGDVYHLLRKSDLFSIGFNMSDEEVVEYLNSDYIRKYIKDTYREITYHLCVSQLKNLPMPNKKRWEEIKKEKI